MEHIKWFIVEVEARDLVTIPGLAAGVRICGKVTARPAANLIGQFRADQKLHLGSELTIFPAVN